MAQTSGDAGLQAFAQSVELALVQAYTEVASAGTITSPAAIDATSTVVRHHQEHARALGEAAGSRATNEPNRRLVTRFRADLRNASDEASTLEVLQRFEDDAASTYVFVLGSLEATPALQLAAAILPVEAEHAVELAGLVRQSPAQTFPSFETQDQAFKPDEFPVS
jgi:hypothetical protein